MEPPGGHNIRGRTLTARASSKNTGAGDDHIVNDCEYALTPNPPPILGLDLAVV